MKRRQAEQIVVEAARAVCRGHMTVANLWATIYNLDQVLETPAAPKSNSIDVTSQNAAAFMSGKRQRTVWAAILRELRHNWQTTDALCVYLNRPHQTVSARVNELRNSGWIEAAYYDLGVPLTRPTRSRQEASVWKLTPRARSIIAGEQ